MRKQIQISYSKLASVLSLLLAKDEIHARGRSGWMHDEGYGDDANLENVEPWMPQ